MSPTNDIETPVAPPKGRRRPRLRAWLKGVTIVLVLLLTLYAVAHVGARWQLERTIRELEERGEPVELHALLGSRESLDEGINFGALPWMLALWPWEEGEASRQALEQSRPDDLALWLAIDQLVPDEEFPRPIAVVEERLELNFAAWERLFYQADGWQWVAADDPGQALLASTRPVHPLILELAAEARTRPAASWPRLGPADEDWEGDDEEWAGDYLSGLLRVSRTLSERAWVLYAVGMAAVEGGDAELAFAVVELGFAMAGLVAETSLMNTYGFANEIHLAMIDLVGRGLTAGVWQEPELARLQNMVHRALADESVFFALRLDCSVFQMLMRAAADDRSDWLDQIEGDEDKTFERLLVRWLPRPYFDHAARFMIEFHHGQLLAEESPLQPGGRLPLAVELRTGSIYPLLIEYGTAFGGPAQIYTQLTRHWRARARLALAEAAVAIERHRLSHGEFAGDWDDLLGEFLETVPVDPFDGQRLRLIWTEDGRPLPYSVGLNRVDNGGWQSFGRVSMELVDLSTTGDIVWRE